MPKRIRTRLFKKLLGIQTYIGHEERMVAFLMKLCQEEGYTVATDEYKNVYVTKGVAEWYPCVAAHIDTVQFFKDIQISREGENLDKFVGYDRETGERHGIGADCKTGVFVCLELLRLCPMPLKVAFFAMEECSSKGARNSDPAFFKDVGYLIAFDCPSRNMLSYTAAGVRLFDNDGPFMEAVLPVFQHYGVSWQHHPCTDVTFIRPKYMINCLNLASGYYNWHHTSEVAYLPDVCNAIEMGLHLLPALGMRHYPYMDSLAPPPVAVTLLAVTHIV